MDRRKTRRIQVGNVTIGGEAPVVVQSMNNTDTRDVKATIEQINALYAAGCELTRVAIPDQQAVDALKSIVAQSPIPVVADIHFDPSLALGSIENGASKIRINPGNIGDRDAVKRIAVAAKERCIPIRVGVNSGSVQRSILRAHGGLNANAMVESALDSVAILENVGFHDIVISIKSSDPMLMIESYRLLSNQTDYPFHLGVTEAGTLREGVVRSSAGIGTLLAEGIGDTIRVSLTDDPVEEIHTAYSILRALGLRKKGITLVSCPTCGRTCVPLVQIARDIDQRIKTMPYDLTVAVMGCAVNGPGEAKEADLGIAGGNNEFLLFKNGRAVRKLSCDNVIEEFIAEIHAAGQEKMKEQ